MLRLVGGLLFLSGSLLMAENLRRTFLGTRTVTVEPPVSIATPVLAPAQRVAMSPVNEP
jgi:cbb3-type cytochrome oxidase subunit 1